MIIAFSAALFILIIYLVSNLIFVKSLRYIAITVITVWYFPFIFYLLAPFEFLDGANGWLFTLTITQIVLIMVVPVLLLQRKLRPRLEGMLDIVEDVLNGLYFSTSGYRVIANLILLDVTLHGLS